MNTLNDFEKSIKEHEFENQKKIEIQTKRQKLSSGNFLSITISEYWKDEKTNANIYITSIDILNNLKGYELQSISVDVIDNMSLNILLREV